MTLILVFLIAGFLIGHFKLIPVSYKLTQRVMLFGLIFLLMVMGAQLGANEKVLADFGHMGLQAVALAAGGVTFSVLLVKMVEGFIKKAQGESQNASELTGGNEKVGEDN
ncbi:MAG: lysine exporter LysO family protein [Firmicutes bacterium]|nr:lysine exporter LysO family protein [Bacillota bacterium]